MIYSSLKPTEANEIKLFSRNISNSVPSCFNIANTFSFRMTASVSLLVISCAVFIIRASSVVLDKWTVPSKPGFWDLMGSAKLVPTTEGHFSYGFTPGGPLGTFKQGAIWSTDRFYLREWDATMMVKIGGTSNVRGSDGMAFMVSAQPASLGNLFGTNEAMLDGIAVILDSTDNDKQKDNPSIGLHRFDGLYRYNQDDDGLAGELGSCIADYRNRNEPIKIMVSFKAPNITILIDIKRNGQWQECVSSPIDLPPAGYHIGFSAQTLDIADRHEVTGFEISGVMYTPLEEHKKGIDEYVQAVYEDPKRSVVHEKLDLLMNSIDEKMSSGMLGRALDEIEMNFLKQINYRALPLRDQGYNLVTKLNEFEGHLNHLRTEEFARLGSILEEARKQLKEHHPENLKDRIEKLEGALKRLMQMKMDAIMRRLEAVEGPKSSSTSEWICVLILTVELVISFQILWSKLRGRPHAKYL